MKKYLVAISFILIFQSFHVFATDTVLEDISCDDVIKLLQDNTPKKVYSYDKNGVEIPSNNDYSPFTLNSLELRGMPLTRLCEYKWKLSAFISVPNPGDAELLIYIKDGISQYGAVRYASSYVIWEYKEKFKKIEEEKQSKSQKQQSDNQKIPEEQNKKSETIKKDLEEYNKSIEDAKKIIEQKQSTITTIIAPTNTSMKLSLINEKKAILLKKRIQLLKKQLELLEKQLESL